MNKEYFFIGLIIIMILAVWLYSRSKSTATKTDNSANLNDDSTQHSAVLEISLQKGDEFLLYVLMHSDGTINRSGVPNETFTDAKLNSTKEVYMGQSDDKMLRDMLSSLNEELVNSDGVHTLNENGDIIELSIGVQIDNRGFNSKYIYGSNSSGPPEFIKTFINKAVALTDKWVEEIKTKKK